LEGGEIAYGILKETGLLDATPEKFSGKTVKVEIDGKTCEAVIK
jgi:hypothetical protein